MHVSGHGPGCALSENENLPNMQVESLETIKDFVVFFYEYSIVKKIFSIQFGLIARTSCLHLGRLTNSSANSLEICNENHMC